MKLQILIYIGSFLFLIFPIFILIRYKKIKDNWLHELSLFLFVSSIYVILWITVFPTFLMIDQKMYVSYIKESSHNNIFPFHTIKGLLKLLKQGIYLNYVYSNLFGNLLLFLPFAFFFKLTFKLKGIYILILSMLFSLSIELIQIPLMRIADIDDIILNTLGAILGLGLAYLFIRLKSNVSKE